MALDRTRGDNVYLGQEGVTKIEPYYENGQMAPVVWFCVWEKDKVSFNVNSAFVTAVFYKTEEEDE